MNITTYNTDAFKLLKTIPDHSVDMVLTDPPFGITDAKWDMQLDCSRVLDECKRVLKPNGVAAVFSSQKFTIKLCAADLNFFRYKYVWKKNTPYGFLNANRTPLRIHEDICIFYEKMPDYHPQKTAGTPYTKIRGGELYKDIPTSDTFNEGSRMPTDVWEYPVVNNFIKVHSCQKPVNLLSQLIKTYTDPDMLVLDAFMGSGSTALACMATGRRFIGCELDAAYYRQAALRISEAALEYIAPDDTSIEPVIHLGSMPL